MASLKEIDVVQKSQLHGLLRIKHEADKQGIVLLPLEELISNLAASMDKEDFAWVEKTVAALTSKTN